MPKKKKKKKRGLFDHLKQVKHKKRPGYWDGLTDEERKGWSSWVIHRFLSMNPHLTGVVNDLQHLVLPLDDRLAYEVWLGLLPPDGSYHPYIKAKGGGDSVPSWLVDRVADFYECSGATARAYVEVYRANPEGLDDLAALARKYALEDAEERELTKFIKKGREGLGA